MCRSMNTSRGEREFAESGDSAPNVVEAAIKGKRGDDDDDRRWPEDASDGHSPLVLFFRRWTFSYMDRILRKGSRQMLADGTHLCQDDLYRIPESMEAHNLDEQFRTMYAQCDENLARTLFRLIAATFVPAGFCQLLTVIAQVSIPLLVRELLAILEEYPDQSVIREGMPYAALIFGASILNAFGNHRQRHLAMKSGVILRATVVSVIYERALALTPKGRAGLTTGAVTNLVAVDTQKLFEVTQDGHLIWSCPLSMIVVTVCLLLIIGPVALVGMAVLVAFVPAVERIGSTIASIRKRRVKISDERVEITNAMLQGMKVTKLCNYESRYLRRIIDAREIELRLLRRELLAWACSMVIIVTSPLLASGATFVTYALIREDNVLTAATTFAVVLLFAALRFPINFFGRLLGRAAQAIESLRRISAFLKRDIRHRPFSIGDDGDRKDKNGKCGTTGVMDRSKPVLSVQNGTFTVGTASTNDNSVDSVVDTINGLGFTLKNVNFSLCRGEIIAIVGPVGCGKTTLVNAIIGDATSTKDTCVQLRGRVAVASQLPFILNATLRDNILFGLPFDIERYEKVLDACCLREDIEQLGGAGDLTEIGERGITLSGGQKQRVSLARVAYSSPTIAIFDDPLSSLDANTGKQVFERLFQSKGNSLLSSTAVVLITHASHFLHRVNKILMLMEGRVEFVGSWEDLRTFECTDRRTREVIDRIRSSTQELKTGNSTKQVRSLADSKVVAAENKDASSGDLMVVEEREHGLSSFKTWLVWFKYAGGILFVATQISLMTIDRCAYVATEWWLARWTQAYDDNLYIFGTEFKSQEEGRSAQYKFVSVYATILLVSCFATFSRSAWAVSGGARCARALFAMMVARVLHAPMSYFETNPLGRTLNRFTFDTEALDVTLTEAMSGAMIATSWFVAGIVVMCAILPWIILAIVPTTVAYLMLQTHYRKSGADLQRLDAVSRSPIQASLAEGLDGASIIRVFRQERRFLQQFQSSIDINSSSLLNWISAQRWLGVRIELLSATIVLVASSLVVCFNDDLNLSPGIVALLIIWCSNFTVTLGFLVDHFAEAEAAITSVERIYSMTELPQEKSMETSETYRVKEDWPRTGSLEFRDVCLRYRDGLPLALSGLSFFIPAGKRCGVVGRTGAGKTTITTALFRLVEAESGQILLDSVDIATLGLSDVRGRTNGMYAIPQDPVLFAGTLRTCLDPFGSYTDDEILDALVAVRLSSTSKGVSVLDDAVSEGGENFSVGERQLVVMARAILAKPKVLVMDEATASIDSETDAFIQEMLRTRFVGTTLLTIAHRLHTVMDYDLILVMSEGRAAEFGSPKALLEQSGVFADLVNSTGDSAHELRAMAMNMET